MTGGGVGVDAAEEVEAGNEEAEAGNEEVEAGNEEAEDFPPVPGGGAFDDCACGMGLLTFCFGSC